MYDLEHRNNTVQKTLPIQSISINYEEQEHLDVIECEKTIVTKLVQVHYKVGQSEFLDCSSRAK